MSLTRPAPTDTLASPALDEVLGEYATAIEALQAEHVTKRVTAALSSAMSGSATTFTTSGQDLNMRFLFAFPIAPTRFRLKMRNLSALYYGNTSTPRHGSGTATVTAYYGAPAAPAVGTAGDAASWRWTGALAATGTQMLFGAATSATLTDEDELATDWINTTAWDSGENIVFSIGLASIAGNLTTAGSDSCGGLTRYASGAAAAASATTFTKTTSLSYLDVRVEYEYSTDVLANGAVRNPVVMFVGDSITAGHVQSEFASAGPWNFKIDTFPEQVGLREQFGIINAGVGQSRIRQSPIGGTTSGWDQITTNDHSFLSRFDLATSVPDAAVIMLGTNDCGASSIQTFTNIVSSYATLIANLRTIGIHRIYACTIPPGGYSLPYTISGSASNNATIITGLSSTRLLQTGMPVSGTHIPSSTVIDAVLSDTSVSITNATTGVISSGSLTFGGTADLTTDAAETLRQQLNTWLRAKPCNITGVFDVTRALESGTPSVADSRYLPYYPHPSIRGFARIADAITF